jgi:hypothetical protein
MENSSSENREATILMPKNDERPSSAEKQIAPSRSRIKRVADIYRELPLKRNN